MKLIGKGSFTKAYLQDNGKVLLKTQDKTKNAAAYGFLGVSRLFPKVEHIGWDEHSEDSLYEMKYYPKVKSLKNTLKPEHWEMYKELRNLTSRSFYLRNTHDYSFKWIEIIKAEVKNRRLKKALLEALEGLMNYGTTFSMECSPRNVAVDSKGNLVLLDIFFCIETLREQRTS